ncbi:hypothetical protein AYI70_g12467, partial [Smittium culicis]
MKLAQLY